MSKKYSASTGGFYDTAIHGDNIPSDAVEITDEQHAALIDGQSQGKRITADADGKPVLTDPPPYVPTQDEIIQSFKDAIQATLDDAARAKNYDDIVSACSYAGYPNAFQSEAIAFGQWRANVWAYGYAELDKVMAGTRQVPTITEILAELPELVLP